MITYAGLAWPVDGNNGFMCIITRREPDKEKVLDASNEFYEIIQEIEEPSLRSIYMKISNPSALRGIYAENDSKFESFIRDFYKWRRETSNQIKIRATATSSFEAGVLKIRDMVNENLIKFPDESKTRAQLRVFSKTSLNNKYEFNAVVALSNVVTSFKKNTTRIQETEPKLSAWY